MDVVDLEAEVDVTEVEVTEVDVAQPGRRASAGTRRRRRAVGPKGAPPAQPADLAVLSQEPGRSDDADADEHLRREVPPHHGD